MEHLERVWFYLDKFKPRSSLTQAEMDFKIVPLGGQQRFVWVERAVNSAKQFIKDRPINPDKAWTVTNIVGLTIVGVGSIASVLETSPEQTLLLFSSSAVAAGLVARTALAIYDEIEWAQMDASWK